MNIAISLYGDGKNSYFQKVSVAGGSSVNQIVLANREISKSGYVYIYVSKESKDFKVYFDNLKVTHIRGPLLSEEGYYPFGMTMNAISSTAGTVAKNNYKFNAGTELNETFDINYYETYFRQYDAQLGRVTGVDALAEQTFSWSTYQFGYNNPVVFNDPTGLFADYSGYQWLPETFKTSRRNAYLNNGYIDIITGNENSSDAQYFLQEHFSYIFGGEGTFNTNFNHFRFGWNSKGQMGYWLPFIGKSDRMMGELREVVVGVKFEVYVDEGDEGADLTSQFNQRIGAMEATFGAVGSTMNSFYGGPVLSYPSKVAAFGYMQYKGAKTEFMNPKAFSNSPFYKGGLYKGEYFSADDFGNYAYGVAARSKGLLSIDAVQGAGIYALFSSSVTDWTNFHGFFDERKDTQMILRGYYGK